MLRRVVFTCASLLCLVLTLQPWTNRAEGQSAPTLLAMTDYSPIPNAAVAIDADGGIYFGHLQTWSRVATTPSRPATIWSRSSDGEVFIGLQNGDLYRLEPDWSLSYDSNVFGGRPTPAGSGTWGGVKTRYR